MKKCLKCGAELDDGANFADIVEVHKRLTVQKQQHRGIMLQVT